LLGVHTGFVNITDLAGVGENALVALGLVLTIITAVHVLIIAVLVMELV
jgi:hypothetical protein